MGDASAAIRLSCCEKAADGSGMGGARMAVYALLLLVGLAGADFAFLLPQDAAAKDASVVYCLLPASRDSLVSAAVSLDLVRPGSAPGALLAGGQRLTLPQWRRWDDAAFQRACDALTATALPAPPGGQASGPSTLVAILLPVIAGALLTMAADDFRQASERRFAQADELRADWAEFAAAVRSYVPRQEDPGDEGIPPSAEIDEKRRKVAAGLRRVYAH